VAVEADEPRLDAVAVAINWGNFAQTYSIGSGPEWRIEVARR